MALEFLIHVDVDTFRSHLILHVYQDGYRYSSTSTPSYNNLHTVIYKTIERYTGR